MTIDEATPVQYYIYRFFKNGELWREIAGFDDLYKSSEFVNGGVDGMHYLKESSSYWQEFDVSDVPFKHLNATPPSGPKIKVMVHTYRYEFSNETFWDSSLQVIKVREYEKRGLYSNLFGGAYQDTSGEKFVKAISNAIEELSEVDRLRLLMHCGVIKTIRLRRK